MIDYRTSAVILAGGAGSRMGLNKAKQFAEILGKTVLERSLLVFDESHFISEIILVTKEDELENTRQILDKIKLNKPIRVVTGGKCRAESAKNGFLAVDPNCDFVAIHDAARCLITSEMIGRVVTKAYEYGAATAVCGVTDTLKIVDENNKISSTIPRNNVYRAQTPQVFSKSIYDKALKSCRVNFDEITDDNMLVENIGVDVYAVNLGATNIKITTRDDLHTARQILIERGEKVVNSFRIGHGYDVHRLVEERKLIIGGVEIPYAKGLLGHSDADVLTHAIMDSILGAAALGDIGRHFPDTDGEYKDISSLVLLEKVVGLLGENGFSVENIDATIVAQKPKISPFIEDMIKNISDILHIDRGRVNIKATTEEHLGFTGRGEGIGVHAVALLKK